MLLAASLPCQENPSVTDVNAAQPDVGLFSPFAACGAYPVRVCCVVAWWCACCALVGAWGFWGVPEGFQVFLVVVGVVCGRMGVAGALCGGVVVFPHQCSRVREYHGVRRGPLLLAGWLCVVGECAVGGVGECGQAR